ARGRPAAVSPRCSPRKKAAGGRSSRPPPAQRAGDLVSRESGGGAGGPPGLPLRASFLRPTIAGKGGQVFGGFRAMPAEPGAPITELLRAAQAGDAGAAERLLAAVYEELHQVDRARMAHLPPGQTLQPTALVHEAYLRLTDKSDVSWESRRH